jgi:hypothetical protein
MRRLLLTALLILLPLGGASAQRGPAPHIWFGPMDPHFRDHALHTGLGDYLDLFQPGAPWGNAASRLSVFKLGRDYVLSASDAELAHVMTWLQQHRIALAMEAPMLYATATCGHVEGFGAPETMAAAQKIKRLGGTLDILSAGEGLWFGHFYNGPSACRSPIPQLVAEQVRSARELQKIFPNIQFDDIEPISNFRDPDWVQEVTQWVDAFRQQFGQPYRAVELDIAWWWGPQWEERARAISVALRQMHMPIGVIYNGNEREQLAYNWILQAEQHWRAYERIAGTPNDAIFQSWNPQPSRNLPENAPDAFTSALIDYARNHR